MLFEDCYIGYFGDVIYKCGTKKSGLPVNFPDRPVKYCFLILFVSQ